MYLPLCMYFVPSFKLKLCCNNCNYPKNSCCYCLYSCYLWSFIKHYWHFNHSDEKETPTERDYQKETPRQVLPVNIAKFLRTPFFIEHLRWLLLNNIFPLLKPRITYWIFSKVCLMDYLRLSILS